MVNPLNYWGRTKERERKVPFSFTTTTTQTKPSHYKLWHGKTSEWVVVVVTNWPIKPKNITPYNAIVLYSELMPLCILYSICKLLLTDTHKTQLFLSLPILFLVCCVCQCFYCERVRERVRKRNRVSWVVWFGLTLWTRRCHAQGQGLTSAWEEHGIASVTNLWEVPSFNKFSGFGFFSFFPPFVFPLCILLTLLHSICLIRVVNDAHSAATKKNREWQEKLPVVVLKAEQIMYSKANSEVFIFFLPSFANACGMWILVSFHCGGENPFCLIFCCFGWLGRVLESWYALGPTQWCCEHNHTERWDHRDRRPLAPMCWRYFIFHLLWILHF